MTWTIHLSQFMNIHIQNLWLNFTDLEGYAQKNIGFFNPYFRTKPSLKWEHFCGFVPWRNMMFVVVWVAWANKKEIYQFEWMSSSSTKYLITHITCIIISFVNFSFMSFKTYLENLYLTKKVIASFPHEYFWC